MSATGAPTSDEKVQVTSESVAMATNTEEPTKVVQEEHEYPGVAKRVTIMTSLYLALFLVTLVIAILNLYIFCC